MIFMQQRIEKTEIFIRDFFHGDASGHDWYHMDRVRKMALKICRMEKEGDPFIIEMGALLHDFLDDKLHEDIPQARNILQEFLKDLGIREHEREQIFHIVENISYRGGNEKELETMEAKIVRDADRLDAIGAIGIARTFAYGATRGNPIYDPKIKIRDRMTMEEYRNGKTSSIHHFYEKLLKLKDLMLTQSGKRLAEERHRFMENFLEEFFDEWKGVR